MIGEYKGRPLEENITFFGHPNPNPILCVCVRGGGGRNEDDDNVYPIVGWLGPSLVLSWFLPPAEDR